MKKGREKSPEPHFSCSQTRETRHSAIMATLPARMEESFSKMRGSLSKFARSNDRRMVLRSMRDVKYLACLPLDPLQVDEDKFVELPSLEEELSDENIVLNGVAFHYRPDFLQVMHALCLKMCETNGVTVNPQILYENLVIRMARSTSSADAHVKLNEIMGSPDIKIMPVPMKKPSTPIELNLFCLNGNVHAEVSSANNFGLFRRADDTNTGRAWVTLHSIVHERVNFSNNQSVRSLRVKIPDLY